jgi:hypothetical protein
MKFAIILKTQDASGLGGEILEGMGMSRVSETVFTRTLPVHDIAKFGTGDTSWSQPEANTLLFVEALMDYGIRPIRVFQKTDSTAGLTPLHASFCGGSEGKAEPKRPPSIERALAEVEKALLAFSEMGG